MRAATFAALVQSFGCGSSSGTVEATPTPVASSPAVTSTPTIPDEALRTLEQFALSRGWQLQGECREERPESDYAVCFGNVATAAERLSLSIGGAGGGEYFLQVELVREADGSYRVDKVVEIAGRT